MQFAAITITEMLWDQTILQKSITVLGSGPADHRRMHDRTHKHEHDHKLEYEQKQWTWEAHIKKVKKGTYSPTPKDGEHAAVPKKRMRALFRLNKCGTRSWIRTLCCDD
jgi:hypothetical protein